MICCELSPYILLAKYFAKQCTPDEFGFPTELQLSL